MRIGVLGGTGVYSWGPGEAIEVETEHGEVTLTRHPLGRSDLFFAPRHGPRHERPAHRVNHHANVAAFTAARVDALVGVFNVGALDEGLTAGSLLVPSDILEVSAAPRASFASEDAVHVPFHEPFCPRVRRALLQGGRARDGGVYASTPGPRFETAAEVRMLRALGADVVGMTCGPEAALAREAGLCYGALCFVGNGADEALDAQAVQARLGAQRSRVKSVVQAVPAAWPARAKCACSQAMRGARLTLAGSAR